MIRSLRGMLLAILLVVSTSIDLLGQPNSLENEKVHYLKSILPSVEKLESYSAGKPDANGYYPNAGWRFDADLGWVADWRLMHEGKNYAWQVRSVSFDEAFRVAMRGAAQVLSGNGQPK